MSSIHNSFRHGLSNKNPTLQTKPHTKAQDATKGVSDNSIQLI